MSRQWLNFDNTDLRDFGLYISGTNVYSSPQRAYNEIIIPGRNGALLGSERRVENIELTYPAFIYDSLRHNVANLRAFLLSRVGYKKLFDSYNPKEFRMAYYAGGLEVVPTIRLDAANFDLTFICKPERYLASGLKTVSLSADGTIVNPTLFDAKPLLRVYGTGSINVNGVTITINETDTYMDIDCEIMEAYKGSTIMNYAIEVDSVYFPVLSPGENVIDLTGVTAVDITPRWYTL